METNFELILLILSGIFTFMMRRIVKQHGKTLGEELIKQIIPQPPIPKESNGNGQGALSVLTTDILIRNYSIEDYRVKMAMTLGRLETDNRYLQMEIEELKESNTLLQFKFTKVASQFQRLFQFLVNIIKDDDELKRKFKQVLGEEFDEFDELDFSS